MMDQITMRSKFRGAMLGSLMGDCLGAPYEFCDITPGTKMQIQKYFDDLGDPNLKPQPFKKYTDDTAMLKSMAKFLIDKPEPDFNFLAKLFVKEFFSEPRRGYGENVVEVFCKLRDTKCGDAFSPAKTQFNGQGSYGNGGAMRVAPVALFYHSDYQKMLEVAEKATNVTHTHLLGVNGALLQCIAVQQALMIDPKNKINAKKFCHEIFKKIRFLETKGGQDRHDVESEECTYQLKMKIVENFLSRKFDDEFDDEVIICLGNGVSAHESVATAIFCFLKALDDDIPYIKTDDIYRRTIQYAISLGGDTDTIACMAGAICGAYLGEDALNKNLMKHCEKYKDIIELADNLFDAHSAPVNEYN
ncbi:unnamed protein product [Brassicogethes aeneus]|uniref:ADP-ribosylhydrolase ARH3 n=1 Tax=Brassicogethes aeneus TaxID=1431903 RepID=A0A9P0BAW7_BRAAE|nr:unnamed protein product [Brassicogethes aeneus]